MKLLLRGLVWLVTNVRTFLYKLRSNEIGGARYVAAAPSPQNAVDILRGKWVCQLPEPLSGVRAGNLALFDDSRIHWMLQEIGGVEGKQVLELGPLEGAHSYMLEQFGAESVTAIEANTHAYLKCLIVKELAGLRRVSFLCGDFVEYLREDGPEFDLIVASGVLYHMRNPVELVALMTRRCREAIYLWTHYYDKALISANPWVAQKHKRPAPAEYEGFEHTLHRYEYQEASYLPSFCGGSAPYSNWMSRQDILRCLEYFGFKVFQIGFDDPQHQGGPAFAVVARREVGTT